MGSNNKGEVVLSVEESGALKVLQRYDFRDLYTLLWPESLSRHPVAEPQKCSPPVAPRVRDDDFIASLKILFVLLLVVCGVLNNMTMFIINQWMYHIVTEEHVLPTICAVIILVLILWKFAIKMREQKKMPRAVTVKIISARIQHI